MKVLNSDIPYFWDKGPDSLLLDYSSGEDSKGGKVEH
jgi:hypothetical protein